MKTCHGTGVLCALVLMLSACGNAELLGPAGADAGMPMMSAGGSAVPSAAGAAGAGVVVGQRLIGPAGGTVRAADVRLEIPAGALSSNVRVTVSVTMGAPRIVRLEPAGTVLARPAVLRSAADGGVPVTVPQFGDTAGSGEVQSSGFILVGG